MARTSSGEFRILRGNSPATSFRWYPISGLLKDACEMTRPRWESRPKASAISFALEAGCAAFVMGDPVELREVLVNMIYNAVDALPRGGEIRLSAQETRRAA